ncbi:S1 family peptidase [Dokdonella sp. MW10]|uniref:S1 family peptidase n=1 Tax=Dokdonella sp. MW10 TaxID=2992926 RepID=UPI003F7EAA1C
MIEALLLAVTRITTFAPTGITTNATGFFFERDGQLFLVTNRHVVREESIDHHPDRLEIVLHVDPANVAETTVFSIPLYRDGMPAWREGSDAGGTIDVVVIALDRAALPQTLLLHAFTPDLLLRDLEQIEVGTAVRIVGFPLGFHDTVHQLPVARQAVVASSFGIRFQGQGYFLTDARMHRGTSGAPVAVRLESGESGRERLVWTLLGIHAGRFDVDNRDEEQDERLSLNYAWYADILMTLTAPPQVQAKPSRRRTAR